MGDHILVSVFIREGDKGIDERQCQTFISCKCFSIGCLPHPMRQTAIIGTNTDNDKEDDENNR